MKREKSLKLNMLLNSIRNISNAVMPLITFPYLSKVLGVENMGKLSFSQSFIDIFILIAGLGVSTYAIRESAVLREEKKKFERFSSQVFTINTCSTAVSCFLLVFLLFCIPKLREYHLLLIIFALQIIFTTLGVEWLYTANEDFAYITARTVLFRFLSLIAVFVFVHSKEDVYCYAWILTGTIIGTGIMNFIYSRKYCSLRLLTDLDLKRHMKPIITLFALSVAINIYVHSDITVLGFFKNDYHVGIYSFSSRIYGLLKSVLASVIAVSIPRLAALKKEGGEAFSKTAMETYSFLITLCIPAIAGIIILRKEMILLLADETYLEAGVSLVILAAAIFFCLGAYFWGQCIMVPNQMESRLFRITCVSALINLSLNLILIPLWAEKAAAFTTLIAEGFCFFRNRHYGKEVFHGEGIGTIYWKVLAGSVPIFLNGILLRSVIDNPYLFMIICILFSILEYLIIEYAVGNPAVTDTVNSVKHRLYKER